ncbi:MAG: hypothetical protein EKK42_26560 [Pseudonocardiaceae bacterium]|nr:MAG: hypothetical protein EKK42_26560 [Pseudonocardiaceae bacterium]
MATFTADLTTENGERVTAALARKHDRALLELAIDDNRIEIDLVAAAAAADQFVIDDLTDLREVIAAAIGAGVKTSRRRR